jgi:redox-sensitive bicupin YhaK (pirin superfamily)
MPHLLRILRVAQAGITHPFGDARTVTQAFPSAIPSQYSDPFLMCDHFNMPSPGISTKPDDFPIDWHPHRGMLVLTYLKTGVGRHGDSMGNRETFQTPGLQWIMAGSGIEHAEGGGTPAGVDQLGFQIWINIPAANKMMDPVYGTESPETIPLKDLFPKANDTGYSFSETIGDNACPAGKSLVRARLLAGLFDGHVGPIQSIAKVQILDLEMDADGSYVHILPEGMDTCMVYVYEGKLVVNKSETVESKFVVLFDATSTSENARGFHVNVPLESTQGAKAMIFIGKKLGEPIAWRGPIVMNTQEEVMQCFQEIRSGKFPPVRAPWNYKRIQNKNDV